MSVPSVLLQNPSEKPQTREQANEEKKHLAGQVTESKIGQPVKVMQKDTRNAESEENDQQGKKGQQYLIHLDINPAGK